MRSHYLAYGSNLHPIRLMQRTPGVRLIGRVQLPGMRLAFNKRSVDGSAKCNLIASESSAAVAYGAVFEIPANEVAMLDQAEGLGVGYDKQTMQVSVEGTLLDAFFYLANDSHVVTNLQPYDWYLALVLAGAQHLDFPEAYVMQIADVASQSDPSDARRQRMFDLLDQIQRADSNRT